MLTEVEIVPYRDGPYLVRGPFSLKDQDGAPIDASRRTIALCRCGKSRTRPFCDGTHRLIKFQAPSAAERYEATSAPRRTAGASVTSSSERSPVGVRTAGQLVTGARAMLAELAPTARSAGSNRQNSDELTACRLLVQGALDSLASVPDEDRDALLPMISQLRAVLEDLLPEEEHDDHG